MIAEELLVTIILGMIPVMEITHAVATILVVIIPQTMVPVVLNGDQNVEITILVMDMIIVAEMIILAEIIIVANKNLVSTIPSTLRT